MITNETTTAEQEREQLEELHEQVNHEVEQFAKSKNVSYREALDSLLAEYQLKSDILAEFGQNQRDADNESMAAEYAAEHDAAHEEEFEDSVDLEREIGAHEPL